MTLSSLADKVSGHGQLRTKGYFLIFVKLNEPPGSESNKERRDFLNNCSQISSLPGRTEQDLIGFRTIKKCGFLYLSAREQFIAL